MIGGGFRTLLPAPARGQRLIPTSSVDGQEDPEEQEEQQYRGDRRPPKRPRKKNRTISRRACDTCRTSKLRCDGASPKCGSCLKRKVDCTYEIHRKSSHDQGYKQQAEILQQLTTGSESHALEILRRLRSSPDGIAEMVTSAGNLSNQYQPSTIRAARASSPPTSSRFEFELCVNHRIAYPSLPPIDMSMISLEPLSNQVVGSTHTPLTFTAPQSSPIDLKHFDERLGQLDIGYWTKVPISNAVAANIISTYLRIHAIWGFFDSQLFIRDLVNKKLQFCSPFLVNALLSCACQSYGAVDPQIPSLSTELMTITERLWRSERSRDSVLNVAAILMFSLARFTTPSEDDAVPIAELIEDGRRMAERLQLFGVRHTDEYAAKFVSLSEEWKRATSFVAWGAYCFMTLTTYYNAGIKPIDFPPLLPTPGSIVDGPEQRLGVMWPTHNLPRYMGKSFSTICKMQTTMQEVAAVYLTQPTLPVQNVPLAFVEAKYQNLLAWTDTLNNEMIQSDGSPDSVVIFHIMLHTNILNLFRPFMQGSGKNHLRSFSSRGSSAETAIRSSVNQLKRIMASCRIHHQGTLSHAITSTAAIHLGNVMLSDAESFIPNVYGNGNKLEMGGEGDVCDGEGVDDDDDDDDEDEEPDQDADPEWHFYFLLCLANCQDLLTCYSVFASVMRGFLSMALQKGVMSTGEARALMSKAEMHAKHHPATAQNRNFGVFYIDLGLTTTRPEAASVAVLAQKFKELLLFDDLTANEDFFAGESNGESSGGGN